ncbi:hypothetical protein L3X38_024005 [Prunus dulcis]|nr:hypothetical protein L3X38_024005 [Prunus dulcis]
MFTILLLLLPCILLHLVNFLLGRAEFPSSTLELKHEEAPQAVPSSSSSSIPETLDFDVFLSFRGKTPAIVLRTIYITV